MIILPAERRIDWKRAPIALLGIVLLNILVFFLYQSADGQRYDKAVEAYLQQNLLAKEWFIYRTYLKKDQQADKLHMLDELYEAEEDYAVAATLLEDTQFYRYLSANGRNFFYEDDYAQWHRIRPRIQADMDSVSVRRFGLKSDNLSVVDLFTHQFLHGDFMHLAGNMVFLMICGFAVEAALGHLTFVVFYLIGGVVAGLSHSLIDSASQGSLIGASGAISAVMAMYLVLFRWRKIQFFYWFYVVAGYFRAPALIILPFYIAKEVYSYYFDSGSNVAFMAHAGGFVAGAVLVAVLAIFRRGVLNSEYLQQADDAVDPYRKALADIYDAIEKYRFDSAEKLVHQAITEHGKYFELQLLQFNLLKLKGGATLIEAVNHILQQQNLTLAHIREQESIWLKLPVSQADISNKTLFNMAVNFTQLDNIITAEQIFKLLQVRGESAKVLSKLANFMAKACARLNQAEQHKHYETLAKQLLAPV